VPGHVQVTRRAEPLRYASIGALALAAGALLLLVARERPSPATAESSAATRTVVRDATAAIERSEPAPRVAASAPGAEAGDTGAARQVGVDIVRSETGEPVPDAQVWCWRRTPVLGSEGDFDEWLRRGRIEEQLPRARKLRADRLGHVEVPEHAQGFVIVAAAGELWGCASFEGLRAGPARVALARDVDLRVRIVDAQGAGVAGLPVALRERRGGSCYDRLLARTDGAEGIAVLRHAGYFLRTLQDQGGEFLVAVQELLDPPLERNLSAGALPEDPIRFVLEPSGSCRVTLVDSSGEPVGGALDARLQFADAPAAEARHSRIGGALVFEHVALGRALLVEARREGSAVLLEARAAGPRHAGERVEMRLVLEPGVAVLRGRALDGAGAPLCERELCAHLGTAEQRVWTSAEGRFALPTEIAAGLCASEDLVLQLPGQSLARVRLPVELLAGSNELGDCVLRELPLLAAGQVVDQAGQPIAGALVRAREGAAETLTNAAGGFEIRGELASEEWSLRAEFEGLVGSPLSVRPPARDLRLVLGPGAALEGRVLLDPSLQQSLVLLVAAREGDTARDATTVLAPDGQFMLGDLAPGRYSLRVVYAADASELAALAGLEVRAGAPTRDARLAPLDLRARERLLELELVDGRGLPIAHGRAYSRPSGEADARWSFAEPDGSRLRILCDGRPLDVTIAAEGYLCSELDHVAGSRRVTLQRAAQLRLELAGGLLLPEPPLYLGVELRPLDAGRSCGFVESRQAFFGPDGVLSCSSAHAGALRAQIVVQRRGPGTGQLVHAIEPLPRILQVSESSAPQLFSIRIDPAALAAAIAAARSED
jgi:hypothetical protein